jgi:hypothetical protein
MRKASFGWRNRRLRKFVIEIGDVQTEEIYAASIIFNTGLHRRLPRAAEAFPRAPEPILAGYGGTGRAERMTNARLARRG